MNQPRQYPSPGRGQSQSQDQSKQRRSPSVTEWLVGGISTVLILSGIGFLVHEAWSGTSLPPLVSVEVHRIVEQPAGGYVVEIVAANRGGTTAQGLRVEGKLFEAGPSRGGNQQAGRDQQGGGAGQQGGGSAIETSSTTLSWVPAHTERKGGLFFTKDPRQYELQLRATGYERP